MGRNVRILRTATRNGTKCAESIPFVLDISRKITTQTIVIENIPLF